MELTPFENAVKKIACVLGIIQGLGYGVMALICIILYNKDDLRLYYPQTYWEIVNSNMYYLYLGPDNFRAFSGQILHPQTFTFFVWVYFILSLGWIGLSIEAFFKKGVVQPKLLNSWCHLTLFISLWDFITVVILGVDYSRCLGSRFIDDSACATGILPVLVIAARGFVLWIVNVVFALVMRKLAQQLRKDLQTHVQQLQSQHMQPQIQQTIVTPVIHQSPSFTGGYPVQQQTPQPNIYVDPYRQQVLGNRNNFEYPVHIPDPDYQYHHPAPPTKRY